jgi:23S rRNA (guanosine2251-2'-O)-methyltransferase
MKKLNTTEISVRHEAQKSEAIDSPLIIILDHIRSALNVGSIFRTADAFAVAQLSLCGITAQPPAREVLKTALGATDTVTWQYFEHTTDAIADAKSKGFTVLAVEQVENSILLQNFAAQRSFFASNRFAIVLGNEVEGVSQAALEACDGCIEIPQFGSKHSLNVSVAAGIVAWEIARNMKYS